MAQLTTLLHELNLSLTILMFIVGVLLLIRRIFQLLAPETRAGRVRLSDTIPLIVLIALVGAAIALLVVLLSGVCAGIDSGNGPQGFALAAGLFGLIVAVLGVGAMGDAQEAQRRAARREVNELQRRIDELEATVRDLKGNNG